MPVQAKTLASCAFMPCELVEACAFGPGMCVPARFGRQVPRQVPKRRRPKVTSRPLLEAQRVSVEGNHKGDYATLGGERGSIGGTFALSKVALTGISGAGENALDDSSGGESA
jgi:hypothetical protein